MNVTLPSGGRRDSCILLMLSGGLDSTYLLHHYLTHSDVAVHVHHVSIRYPEQPRWKFEAEAVQRIVPHCQREYRPFAFTTSSFSLDLAGDVGWDSDLQLLVASKVVPSIRAPWITVALGWSAEDLEHPSVVERARRDVTPTLWRALWASLNNRTPVNPVLAMPLLEGNIRKEQMMQALPRELARMTWSCRSSTASTDTPARPCGTCRPCGINRLAAQRAGLGADDLPNLLVPS